MNRNGTIIGWATFLAVTTTSFAISRAETSKQPHELAKTQWNLTEFNKDGVSTTPMKQLTLNFESEYRVGGNTGCNHYGGDVHLNGKTLSFGSIASTKRACSEELAMQQETRFLGALANAKRFELNKNRLSVSSTNDELIFTKASDTSTVEASGVEKNMNVSRATITRIKRNVFKITASGSAPTPGWATRLSPVTYVRPPENWLIQAVGARPDNPVIQLITGWNSSVVLGLGPQTKQVTVQGAGEPVILSVPHTGRPTRTATVAATY